MGRTAQEEMAAILRMTPEEQDKYFESLPPDKTSTLLVEDLERKPQSAERDAIIVRAKAYGYDDFKFTMMYGDTDTFCPKVLLVEHLAKAGFEDLVENVMVGKYD